MSTQFKYMAVFCIFASSLACILENYPFTVLWGLCSIGAMLEGTGRYIAEQMKGSRTAGGGATQTGGGE